MRAGRASPPQALRDQKVIGQVRSPLRRRGDQKAAKRRGVTGFAIGGDNIGAPPRDRAGLGGHQQGERAQEVV